MTRTALVLLVVVLTSHWAPRADAGTVSAGSDGPSTTAFVGATVHVGDGRTVLRGATLLVRGDRIADVGHHVRVPAGARVIDASGLHLTPGLTAADTVLGLTEISAVRSTRDEREVGRLNPHVQAWRAVNPDSELLGVTLAAGVTQALVAPRGGLVAGRSAIVELRGWTIEDMTLRAPAALHVNWPSHRVDRSPRADPGAEEQERRRRDAVALLDDLMEDARVHVAAREARAGRRVPRADRDLRLEAVAPALTGDLPVVVHADRQAEIRAAVAWARRQGLRMILAGGRDAWRLADELSASSIPVVIGSVRALPARDHEPHDVAFRNPVILHEAGVTVCFTEGRAPFSAAHARNLPHEAAMAVAHGMPEEAALRALTLSPAEVFGVAEEIGSVERGKRANLVAWDGPPLEVASGVVHVVLGGRLIEPEDRHHRLWQKYAARP